MNEFQKTFQGKLLLAPMEDVTEPPFRLSARRLGADIVYTEFISAEGLIRDARKAKAKLFFHEEERPIGIQIYGGNEDNLREAARISESVDPDFIDINCGCWVKDVAMRGAGAGLLKDIPKMARIAETIVGSVKLPVTLKTRLGWDENSIVIVDVARLLESIGIQVLTVHCRLRSQGNKGEADWSWIKRIKDSGVNMPIVLNGNIKSPEDVKFVFDNFDPDAVMIGQAAISNPWIFRQARQYWETGTFEEPSVSERVDHCIEHLRLSVEYKGEKYGVKEFRKHYSGYLRGLRDVSKFRLELMQYDDFEPLRERLIRFKEEFDNAAGPQQEVNVSREQLNLT
jgi:tRNA-dihydrouridine synthase B